MSNKQNVSFESEHKAFAYLFAGLITLCAFPVLAWHYATTLEGFAVLAIGGLLATDAVMWFAAHWSVKTRSSAMRAVSLIVKFLIASVAVCEEAGSRDPVNFPSLSSDKQSSGAKPVQVWRGGVLVEPSKGTRLN